MLPLAVVRQTSNNQHTAPAPALMCRTSWARVYLGTSWCAHLCQPSDQSLAAQHVASSPRSSAAAGGSERRDINVSQLPWHMHVYTPMF